MAFEPRRHLLFNSLFLLLTQATQQNLKSPHEPIQSTGDPRDKTNETNLKQRHAVTNCSRSVGLQLWADAHRRRQKSCIHAHGHIFPCRVSVRHMAAHVADDATTLSQQKLVKCWFEALRYHHEHVHVLCFGGIINPDDKCTRSITFPPI